MYSAGMSNDFRGTKTNVLQYIFIRFGLWLTLHTINDLFLSFSLAVTPQRC